jgi:hypothetical protein
MLPQLLDLRPYFADLPDPRRETRNKLHKLHDILMIVLLLCQNTCHYSLSCCLR